jgi:hypothetical protein
MKLRQTVLVFAALAALGTPAATGSPARAQERGLDPVDRPDPTARGDDSEPARYALSARDERADAGAASARDACGCPHDRRGWLVGFELGTGGGKPAFETAARDHDPDPELGFLATLRLGYAVSNSIAFSVEAQGFGRDSNGSEWNGGALLGSLTWWPDGGGFFLRLGVGAGGVDLVEPHDDGVERKLEREGSAALLALGYEWQIRRTFALGLLMSLVALDLDDTDDLHDLRFGYGGFAIQFHWYL